MTLKDIFPHHEMQFAPVQDDNDDLTNAISDDSQRQDDTWQLKEDIDGEKLVEFWDNALQDLGTEDAEK